MTIHVSKRVLAVLGVVGLLGAGIGIGFLVFRGNDDSRPATAVPEAVDETSTAEADATTTTDRVGFTPNPRGRYHVDCDYLLGDNLNDYSFVASGTLRNTGNVGIVTRVTIEWEQIGTDPVTHEETVAIPKGKSRDVQVEIPVTGDQVDRIQSVSGRECHSNVKIIDTFHGDGADVATGASGLQPYTSRAGGWSADVPSGNGWSDPVESEPTPGQLFRTEISGPAGAVLIIDATPFQTPTFNAATESRQTVSHPVFDSAEEIIFQGSENIPSCASNECVDFLLSNGSGGGYAVLAGGSGDFESIRALAQKVMLSLRPNDV
jgi:hypothetical protein